MPYYADVGDDLVINKYYFADEPTYPTHIEFPAGWDPCHVIAKRAPDGSVYIDMAPTYYDSMWSVVRMQRDQLLAKSDWTQTLDAPISKETQQAWQVYRTELRNLPNKFATPYDVVWPEPPK